VLLLVATVGFDFREGTGSSAKAFEPIAMFCIHDASSRVIVNTIVKIR
jgi:hypothetical protein